MTSINGVNSYAAMSELLQAQSKQLAEVMTMATNSGIDMAMKLAVLSAQSHVEAAKQGVVGQVLDMFV